MQRDPPAAPEAPPIEGVIVPVVTPVDERDRLEEPAFRAIIRRCLAAGVNGIFAGGSAGMGPLLTDREWRRMIAAALEETRGRARLLAGVACASTALALQRIRFLQRAGCDTFVLTPTFYIALTRDEEFLAHYGRCRDATGMEMVVYNIPACTGSNIPVHVALQMAAAGWTRTCKESSGSPEYFDALLEGGRPLGLRVLDGHEPSIERSLRRGAAGIVPVCANYEPATLVAAWQAARQGDLEALARAQERVLVLREALLTGDMNWIAGILWGMATLGFGSGRPALPLQKAGPAARRAIEALRPAGAG